MRRIFRTQQVRQFGRSLAARSEAEPAKEKVQETLPIEKRSITRGLALNRVDKNYLLFPDYDDDSELENVRKYLSKLGDGIDSALAVEDPKERRKALNECLKSNSVNGLAISTLFGGLNASRKDQVQLNELIGSKDLSLSVQVNKDHLAAYIIQTYATPEQKDEFLPKLASGEINIALCFLDDNNATSTYSKVTQEAGRNGLLNGKKQNVLNARDADYFLVVARNELGNTSELYCYIVPKEQKSGKIKISEPKTTQGLNGVEFSDVEFVDVPVNLDDICGSVVDTHDMINDYVTANRINHASAAIGCVKRVLSSLVDFAHKRRIGNTLLAQNPSVESSINHLSVDLFVLESMVYYLAGMADEKLYPLNDIENMITQRLANKTLRQAILSISEVAGLDAVDTAFDYAKHIKDITSVLSLGLPDLTLIRAVALPTVDSYVKNSKAPLNKSKYFTPKRVFFTPTEHQDYKDPKAIHFLAECADPALEMFCRELEYSTWRLERTLEKVCVRYATELKTDFYTQTALADILEAQLGMVATIARSTRAAALGLRTSEAQLGWTMFYCYEASRKAQVNTEILQSYYDILVTNPSILTQGKLVLNENGYPMESPIERNW
ncbi:unnamed protein product [Bursaphelenchus xylophilus]|uniref:(pine wood nematode) hypothetical protein n=1 Tax=Bursaphelenchus xylophilus TaxID=6326 RepID=A0A1I7S674_BURXY|nr:unnamed protein product [Bursaphelenchus xylophilus]CAG9081075.1 unnamed protein product [Bursaphelenchus xylophilus]